MIINKYWLIIFLLITFLCLSITSIWAAQSSQSNFHSYPIIFDEAQIRLELLKSFIKHNNSSLNEAEIRTLSSCIISEANTCGFDPFLISSIIAAESSFYPNAVSPCKALGLMQLTSCVYEPMHIKDPFNIKENIYGGTRFLKYLKGRFSDLNLILAAYNAGPTRVARLGRIPEIKETILYVKKVNRLLGRLQQQMNTTLQNLITSSTLCPIMITISNQKLLKKISTLCSNVNSSQSCNQVFLCDADRSLRFLFLT